MRGPSKDGKWSVTTVLVIANIVAFVLQLTILPHLVDEGYLALSLEGIERGYIWQLLTYQFLHAVPYPWHVLVNCWMLYMFGREIETVLGPKRFLLLYLMSGIVGGLFQVFAAWVWPMHFAGASVGASAGVSGVTAAFAMVFPNEILLLLGIIPMRAKNLIFLMLGITALGISFPEKFGGNVAHAAHLGGILTGLAFSRRFLSR